MNVLNTYFDSPSYCKRLEKYAGRGFRVAWPGLPLEALSRKMLSANYVLIKDYDLVVSVAAKDR